MDRRTFLQLSAMGLMVPGQVSAVTTPALVKQQKNLVLVSVDLGLYEKFFREGGVNCKYMEKFFYDFKGSRTYFNGMHQPEMTGGHPCQPATFTCMKFEDRQRYPQRPFISLDQGLAQATIQETRHKLIYHQVSKGGNFSWNRFAQPMPAIKGANALHNQLFEKTDEARERAFLRRERTVLMALGKNLKRRWRGIPEELTMRDSITFQLEAIEEKEKWLRIKKPYLKKAFDANVEDTPLISCKHNFQLIYDALEKQQTKIAMIQFGGGRLTRGVKGVNNGYHTLSHHGYYKDRTHELSLLDSEVLSGLQGFLELLQNGGLYDDTIVLFTCAMANANAHDNKRAPFFLFGGGFKHQEQIDCQNESGKMIYPTTTLYSSILKQCGLKDTQFSGNTKIIKELF